MPPASKSARTNDMPNVFRPGNTLAPTGMDEKPVLLESAGDFMPENTKSSTVTRDEFLQETKRDENSGLGMQKSCSGSESEDETKHVCRKRTSSSAVNFNMFDLMTNESTQENEKTSVDYG